MSSLLLYCRPGFEAECASEIHELAGRAQADVRYDARCGYVIFRPHDTQLATQLHAQLAFSQLVFSRQWFVVHDYLKDLPRGDRIGPLVARARQTKQRYAGVFIETPDSEASKPLLPLCRALQTPLSKELSAAGLLEPDADLRLHVCFFTTDYAALGYAGIDNSAAWPGGIPRLRRLREAPSRSAQKLEEALLVLLSEEQRRGLLHAGMSAVDLGAAPETAQLAPSALATGLIEHIRADGFHYQPRKTVDWLLCDMVEQPARIAKLIGSWFVRGSCRHAVFNLKLPMKKRYPEYQHCLKTLRGMLAQTGLDYRLRGRQLYHDRDEITLCITTR
jgi:23S rRNA (cytidine2498-2'-O)-methyltransferase